MSIHDVAAKIFIENPNDQHKFCLEMQKFGNRATYTTNQRKFNLMYALSKQVGVTIKRVPNETNSSS